MRTGEGISDGWSKFSRKRYARSFYLHERWLTARQTIDALRSGTFVPSSEDISFVQKKEDETNRVIMMLRANSDILESIGTFYKELMQNVDFPLKNESHCQRAVADFMVELRDYTHDFQLHVERAQTLGRITAARKNLVQQHLQAHATAKMEVMTYQAQKEAVTMRIIAVVTLIYLPATFVSVRDTDPSGRVLAHIRIRRRSSVPT